MTQSDWPDELRRRIESHSKELAVLSAQLLADRMVNQERHRQHGREQESMRFDLKEFSAKIDNIGKMLSDVSEGQRSIRQSLAAADVARVDTAKALKDADEARRTRDDLPWVTPSRVLLIITGAVAVLSVITQLVSVR